MCTFPRQGKAARNAFAVECLLMFFKAKYKKGRVFKHKNTKIV